MHHMLERTNSIRACTPLCWIWRDETTRSRVDVDQSEWWDAYQLDVAARCVIRLIHVCSLCLAVFMFLFLYLFFHFFFYFCLLFCFFVLFFLSVRECVLFDHLIRAIVCLFVSLPSFLLHHQLLFPNSDFRLSRLRMCVCMWAVRAGVCVCVYVYVCVCTYVRACLLVCVHMNATTRRQWRRRQQRRHNTNTKQRHDWTWHDTTWARGGREEHKREEKGWEEKRGEANTMTMMMNTRDETDIRYK